MEIHSLAFRVDAGNSGAFEVALERVDFGHGGEDLSAWHQRQFAQFRYHIGVEGNHGHLLVLGGRGPDIHERLLGVQVQVFNFQLLEFLVAQTGMHRHQVNHLAWPRHIKQSNHLLVGVGAARAGLLAVAVHLRHRQQRIALQSLKFEHPIEECANGGEIFVESLGREVLLGPPLHEGIRGNVFDVFPAAFPEEPAHAALEVVDVLRVPPNGFNVGYEIAKMRLQWQLSSGALRMGSEKPNGFHLPFLHDFLKALLGNALVGCVQRNVLKRIALVDPKPSPIRAGNLNFAVLEAAGTKDGEVHKAEG